MLEHCALSAFGTQSFANGGEPNFEHRILAPHPRPLSRLGERGEGVCIAKTRGAGLTCAHIAAKA